MSRTNRTYRHKSETNIWVFSKRNEQLRPGEIAKIVNGMAQERAPPSAPQRRSTYTFRRGGSR